MDDFIEYWFNKISPMAVMDAPISEYRPFIRDLCRALTDRHVAAIDAVIARGTHESRYISGFDDGVKAAIRAIQEENKE